MPSDASDSMARRSPGAPGARRGLGGTGLGRHAWALIVLAAFVSHGEILLNAFVWDDISLVEKHPRLDDLGLLREVLHRAKQSGEHDGVALCSERVVAHVSGTGAGLHQIRDSLLNPCLILS